MPSARCVGAMLVRNEAGADRYLQRVLNNVAQFVDEIVVVDDGSTDATAALCAAHPAVSEVVETPNGGWWGAAQSHSESPQRARLWNIAREHAGGDVGWIYVCDADHELLGIAREEFRALLGATLVDSWACPLWDCWDSEDLQRVDGYWQAWAHPRPWLFRALNGYFGDRAIHCGHAPWRHWTPGLMPPSAGVRHLGYVNPLHRQRKMAAYLALQNAADSVKMQQHKHLGVVHA